MNANELMRTLLLELFELGPEFEKFSLEELEQMLSDGTLFLPQESDEASND